MSAAAFHGAGRRQEECKGDRIKRNGIMECWKIGRMEKRKSQETRIKNNGMMESCVKTEIRPCKSYACLSISSDISLMLGL